MKNELNSGFTVSGSSYDKVPESADMEYKRSVWDTAMGLQAVDGLSPSKLLQDLAEENIKGQKTYEEVENELKKKYGETENNRQCEADIVSGRIAQLLEESKFVFSTQLLLSIHDFLFEGLLEDNLVGRFRRYNITKKEPVLYGDTVIYTEHLYIKSQLCFLMDEEQAYSYGSKMSDDDILHLSEFTRNIWQTHPFGEGNTRTTAVFIQMYLRSLGFAVDNTPFKDHSDYYRNALVRSCYKNDELSVVPTYEYLNKFYNNLLCGTKHILDNDELYIVRR